MHVLASCWNFNGCSMNSVGSRQWPLGLIVSGRVVMSHPFRGIFFVEEFIAWHQLCRDQWHNDDPNLDDVELPHANYNILS
jgi:hypothetical protein